MLENGSIFGVGDHEGFENIVDAIAVERRLKGWSRAKKEALIRSDFEALKRLAKQKGRTAPSSFDKRAKLAAQDEDA